MSDKTMSDMGFSRTTRPKLDFWVVFYFGLFLDICWHGKISIVASTVISIPGTMSSLLLKILLGVICGGPKRRSEI